MGREIERKFLVRGEGWRRGGKTTTMRQGYLCASKERSVRVRLEDGIGTLTIKGPSRGLARAEYEYRIPPQDAARLLDALCERPLIEKTRTRTRRGGLTWEIDEFQGENAGLIVAEVELERKNQRISLPPWAGREVSEDPRYLNANLFRNQYRNWAAGRRPRRKK